MRTRNVYVVASVVVLCTAVGARDLTPPPDSRLTRAVMVDHLLAATFLGGSGLDGHYETPVIRDPAGNVFVAGRTSSPDLPTTPGAYDSTLNGQFDIMIAKISPNLDSLLACTYLGGSSDEGDWPGVDLAIDWAGHVVVVAPTVSIDYPCLPGAYDSTLNGSWDIAVSRLSSDLTTLLASTYLGGVSSETYTKVLADRDGRIVVTGSTASANFPYTSGVFDSTFAPGGTLGYDVFVSVLDSNLSQLIASTFVGHSNDDIPEALVESPAGGYYVAGWTASPLFPSVAGSLYPAYRGGSFDGFIFHIAGDLSGLIAGTFIGGTAWDFSYDLALDPNGNVLATGHTASRNSFPTTASAYDVSYNSPGGEGVGDDAYVIRLSPALDSLITGSYLGGAGWENGEAIEVDPEGRVFVSGNTNSSEFPHTPETIDSTVTPGYQYASDIFLCVFDANVESMLFGTILGGSSNDNVGALSTGDDGQLYVSGSTASTDFPVTPGGYDTTHNGGVFDWGGDVFLARLTETSWDDHDSDGIADIIDNCAFTFNPDQSDIDEDGQGDSCDCSVILLPMPGDVDQSLSLTASDIIYLVNFTFKGGSAPQPCEANGDVNCSGSCTSADIIYMVNHVFKGGPEPCDVCWMIDVGAWECP